MTETFRVNDDFGIKICYYTGFENYDTRIASPMIRAEIKEYYYRDNAYNIKNKNGDILRNGNFIVEDDQVNNRLNFTITDQFQTEDDFYYSEGLTFKYSVKDKNTIEMVLYSDMDYNNMFGPFGKKIEIHKSSEKTEMTNGVKRDLIDRISGVISEKDLNSQNINEFYYNKTDSAVEMAYKIKISDLNELEKIFNSEESTEYVQINKKDIINYPFDWWKFDIDNVVEAYKDQDGWSLTDMYGVHDTEYVIVKENNKHYVYFYSKIVMMTEDEVKEDYDNMDDWELKDK